MLLKLLGLPHFFNLSYPSGLLFCFLCFINCCFVQFLDFLSLKDKTQFTESISLIGFSQYWKERMEMGGVQRKRRALFGASLGCFTL